MVQVFEDFEADEASVVQDDGEASQSPLGYATDAVTGALFDLLHFGDASGIEDSSKNTTRFIIMAKKDRAAAGVSGADDERPASGTMMTSFVFRVRNIPAALYKALGGFATNGVNMTKLESYMVNGEFTATQFYADIEGSPSDKNVSLAMEELEYFTSHIMILGTYLADRRRVHPGGD